MGRYSRNDASKSSNFIMPYTLCMCGSPAFCLQVGQISGSCMFMWINLSEPLALPIKCYSLWTKCSPEVKVPQKKQPYNLFSDLLTCCTKWCVWTSQIFVRRQGGRGWVEGGVAHDKQDTLQAYLPSCKKDFCPFNPLSYAVNYSPKSGMHIQYIVSRWEACPRLNYTPLTQFYKRHLFSRHILTAAEYCEICQSWQNW